MRLLSQIWLIQLSINENAKYLFSTLEKKIQTDVICLRFHKIKILREINFKIKK